MAENPSSKVIESVQHPLIRALVQLVPGGIGSAIDVLLADRLQRIQKQRIRHFFEQLEIGEQFLTAELIASDDFLHCFFASIRATQRARHQEKINLFANLLRNSTMGADSSSAVDDFEEDLSIIEDLSLREWRAIVMYDRMIKDRHNGMSQIDDMSGVWRDILKLLERELGLPENEIVSFLHRISRSGLLGQVNGFFVDREWLIPTAKFDRIKHLVSKNCEPKKV